MKMYMNGCNVFAYTVNNIDVSAKMTDCAYIHTVKSVDLLLSLNSHHCNRVILLVMLQIIYILVPP